MYEAYFGFTERPFAAIPRSDRYFPAAAVEAARQTLIRCIDRVEGCGLIVGPAGTGKTLLCQVLADHFQPRLDVVLLSSIHLGSSKEMLQAIAFELGLPYKRLDEGELRLSLIDRISPREESRDGMLLIVDEAHALSPKVLEEMRLLTNLIRGGSPRVRLVLAGAPVLDERFASPRLASFNQRLAARCYLEPFSAEESHEYVRAHTAVAGADPDRLWTVEALRAIHHATDGCPRLINQLCDLTLMLAASASASQVDDGVVNEAWAELQQLPMPWNVDQRAAKPESEESSAPASVVEFGSLDDETESEEDVVAREPVNLDSAAPATEIPETVEPEAVEPEAVEPEAVEPEAVEPEAVEPEDVEPEAVAWESVEPQRDDHSELFADLEATASNAPIEVPADPTSQVDRIEAHLVSVQQTFVQNDFDAPPVAENDRCQVELIFDEATPAHATGQRHDAEADTARHVDDGEGEIAGDRSVVVKDFAGLEGDTVLRLSPNPRAISADDVQDEPVGEEAGDARDDAIGPGRVLEMDRPKGSWLSGLARVMEQPADSGRNPFGDPTPIAPAPADTTDAIEMEGPAASPQLIESNFVDLQYVHETAQVIDNDRHDPVAPMPSVVVEYTADNPTGHDRCEEVESHHVRAEDVAPVLPIHHESGEEVEAGLHHPDAKRAIAATSEIRSPVEGHPTIPVRQREYRQLFAKLRQREMQEDR